MIVFIYQVNQLILESLSEKIIFYTNLILVDAWGFIIHTSFILHYEAASSVVRAALKDVLASDCYAGYIILYQDGQRKYNLGSPLHV